MPVPEMQKTDKAQRILSALTQANTHTTTPVWVMRQAGRYLPEYMAFTEGTDFFHNCQTPERAKTITLQPERMDIDAAILFSDILIVPQAMGMRVSMCPGKGPQFEAPLSSIGDIQPIVDAKAEDKKDLSYTKEALQLIRSELDGRIPLIGFTGAPWTLMCYMVEGSSKASYLGARRWLWEHPEASKKLLSMITDACIDLLLMQIDGGAQMIQMFESHGGEITPECFEEFELPCLERIAKAIKAKHPSLPVVLFARNCQHSLEACFASSYDAVSIDCNTSLTLACTLAKKYKKAVQGNIDPCILYAPDDVIRAETTKMLDAAAAVLGTTSGGAPASYVANLGWGMQPSHKPEKLQVFIDTVHAYKQK